MKDFCVTAVVFVLISWVAASRGAQSAEKGAAKAPLVAHNVFFALNDNSQPAKKALVDDCHKLLSPLPGIVFYAAGTLSDMKRDVNDRDFDVALHVVFKDQAALEAYLAAPPHLEFVKKHQANFKKIRVFDSDVRRAPKAK
jgi:hypothetical protein